MALHAVLISAIGLSAAAAAGWMKGLLRGLAAHARSGWLVRMICPPFAKAVGSVVSYWTAWGTERPELSSRKLVKCESAELRNLERRAGRVSC
jgi:hypothetical protein